MAPHIDANRLLYELGCTYGDLFFYFDSYNKEGRSYPFYPKNIAADSNYKDLGNDIYELLCDWHLECEDVIYIDF
jgi:hypothetical protein